MYKMCFKLLILQINEGMRDRQIAPFPFKIDILYICVFDQSTKCLKRRTPWEKNLTNKMERKIYIVKVSTKPLHKHHLE